MTLDEAIKYHSDKAEKLRKEQTRMAYIGNEPAWGEYTELADEHAQLTEWLEELKTARIRLHYIKQENPELAARCEVFADFAQSDMWKGLAEAITATVNKISETLAETSRRIAETLEEKNHGND